MKELARPEFAYTYCYVNHHVASLRAHLEEEDPFEPHAAVCTPRFLFIYAYMLLHENPRKPQGAGAWIWGVPVSHHFSPPYPLHSYGQLSLESKRLTKY